MSTTPEQADALRDHFRGDNAALIAAIEALLRLDAANALRPHGVGGFARDLLSSAAVRLAAQAQPEPAAWQVRVRFTDPDEGWSGWRTFDGVDLAVYKRRANEQPSRCELRPLYPPAAQPEAQADIRQMLKDPAVVHAAMLRGEIALPDVRSLLHLHGEAVLARWDSMSQPEAQAVAAAEADPVEAEREALRAGQTAEVMPMIGPLLDAWEGVDPDTIVLIQDNAPDLAARLYEINHAMEHATPQPEPRKALSEADAQFLTPDDLADLERLDGLFSDGEGWDLPKERMAHLAEIGVIRRTGGNYYQVTAFGMHCIDDHWGLPLRTRAQINEDGRRAMELANGISQPAAAQVSDKGGNL